MWPPWVWVVSWSNLTLSFYLLWWIHYIVLASKFLNWLQLILSSPSWRVISILFFIWDITCVFSVVIALKIIRICFALKVFHLDVGQLFQDIIFIWFHVILRYFTMIQCLSLCFSCQMLIHTSCAREHEDI